MDWIALGIYAVMAFFILMAVPCLFKLAVCSRQLKHAAGMISTPEEGSGWREMIIGGLLRTSEIFQSRELQYQMDLYQAEIANEELGGGAYTNCDIGEFFHEDLLDHIGNKPKCEQTANALTALGILGTFLGLASGLKGFNFSDTSNIIHGIENLLQGMSTAFWTSIVGIILSLAFTAVYQRIARNAQTNLDSFLDQFRRNVLDDQTDTAMRRIVEELSVLENLDTAMASAVGEAVGRHMDGQMDRIIETVQTSCAEMAKSQSRYLETLSQNQTHALEKMVTDFTRSLQESLGTHFDGLGQSIDKASREYAKFAGELSVATSAVDGMRISMEEMQRLSAENVRDLADFSHSFSQTVQNFGDSLTGMDAQLAAMNAGLEQRMKALDDVLDRSSKAAAAQAESAKSILECSGKILEVVAAAQEQTKQLKKTSEELAGESEQTLRRSGQALAGEMDGFRRSLQGSNEKFQEALRNSNKEFLEGIQAQSRAHQASMQTQMEKMTELVEAQIEKMRTEKRRGLFGRK